MPIIIGVATRNRRKPKLTGSMFSLVTVLTTIKDPAQTKETKIRRSEMRICLFIKKVNNDFFLRDRIDEIMKKIKLLSRDLLYIEKGTPYLIFDLLLTKYIYNNE